MMAAVRDKVVLITGASSGIGRETALRLSGLGARVALASRNQEVLREVAGQIKARSTATLVLPTDVTDADQCRQAIAATVERFGVLDILVCSAGISMRAYFETSDLAALERVIRVNFLGTLYPTYFAIPHVKRQRGSLVAISSLTGRRGIPSYGVYGASKFAIQGLYDSLRVELRSAGVHVGVVSPGFVDTPLRERVLGPTGQVWKAPPPPPFRVWPVAKCVDRVVRLIVKRQSQALLPWYAGPMFAVDQALGGKIGDFLLARKFPSDHEK